MEVHTTFDVFWPKRCECDHTSRSNHPFTRIKEHLKSPQGCCEQNPDSGKLYRTVWLFQPIYYEGVAKGTGVTYQLKET